MSMLLEVIYKSLLKKLHEERNNRLDIEKHKWYNFKDEIIDDEIESLIKSDIVDIVNKSYSSIGGHAWIKKPEDLNWYDDINFIDNDEDLEIDATVIGKEGPYGIKMAAGARDGSVAGKKAYVDKSAELRSQGGYWGEVSGAIAHKLIKKGLNTISDRNKVESLVGLNINWFGDCPVSHPSFHGNVPDTFKNAKGWYERDIGGEKHMKIIIGIPKVS